MYPYNHILCNIIISRAPHYQFARPTTEEHPLDLAPPTLPSQSSHSKVTSLLSRNASSSAPYSQQQNEKHTNRYLRQPHVPIRSNVATDYYIPRLVSIANRAQARNHILSLPTSGPHLLHRAPCRRAPSQRPGRILVGAHPRPTSRHAEHRARESGAGDVLQCEQVQRRSRGQRPWNCTSESLLRALDTATEGLCSVERGRGIARGDAA